MWKRWLSDPEVGTLVHESLNLLPFVKSRVEGFGKSSEADDKWVKLVMNARQVKRMSTETLISFLINKNAFVADRSSDFIDILSRVFRADLKSCFAACIGLLDKVERGEECNKFQVDQVTSIALQNIPLNTNEHPYMSEIKNFVEKCTKASLAKTQSFARIIQCHLNFDDFETENVKIKNVRGLCSLEDIEEYILSKEDLTQDDVEYLSRLEVSKDLKVSLKLLNRLASYRHDIDQMNFIEQLMICPDDLLEQTAECIRIFSKNERRHAIQMCTNEKLKSLLLAIEIQGGQYLDEFIRCCEKCSLDWKAFVLSKVTEIDENELLIGYIRNIANEVAKKQVIVGSQYDFLKLCVARGYMDENDESKNEIIDVFKAQGTLMFDNRLKKYSLKQ
ncbi:hypothetical protein ACOME3_001722 [Neoechinorhynchus agilis]